MESAFLRLGGAERFLLIRFRAFTSSFYSDAASFRRHLRCVRLRTCRLRPRPVKTRASGSGRGRSAREAGTRDLRRWLNGPEAESIFPTAVDRIPSE